MVSFAPRRGRFSVVTGASGLLGSYITELLVGRGEAVRVLVRATSDDRLLQKLGVEVVRGDLTDARFVHRSIAGAEVVYHCAGQTGNWGPWEKYARGNISTTWKVVDACGRHRVGRLLHVSSIAVYGHPRSSDEPLAEDQPLGQHLWSFDHYNRSKIEAEKIVRRLGSHVTIVRPTWFYGPRDRAFIPRLLRALQKGRVRLIGCDDPQLNGAYVTDIAEGAVLAANHPESAGQVYNLCSQGGITQQEFLDLLCDAAELPRVRRWIPPWAAHYFAYGCEIAGRLLRRKEAPPLTRHALSVFSRPARFSCAKVRAQLGWETKVTHQEGIRRTIDWMHGGAPFHEPVLAHATRSAPAEVNVTTLVERERDSRRQIQ